MREGGGGRLENINWVIIISLKGNRIEDASGPEDEENVQIFQYNTIQYNFIAKCQYTDCTRNVLWSQVHSSHIHSSHKTFKYNNSK